MKHKKLKPRPVGLQALNLPRFICLHMIGENHHITHRMMVGIVIGFIGVEIARCESDVHLVSVAYETGGYFVHAIGSIPFCEFILGLRE